MADYLEIFEKLPIGITIHDADNGSIVDANQQFSEMLGYTQEELLELDFEAIHINEPPYTSDRAEQYVRKAATSGPQTFEWCDETKDGNQLPVEVHLRQAIINDEKRILAVVRDITERKEREQELQKKNERLERFASVVSHDLRNPLNVAQGRLKLSKEECDTDHLDEVERAHQRMDSLIEDLLRLAQEGNTVMELSDSDLTDIIKRCWQTVETEEATLLIDTESTIRADRPRLRQLFENLIRNAIEHGGEDVTVTVGDLPDGFFIEDTGAGIPESRRTKIFQQGYSSTSTGTGYGLQIVKETVEAHGWYITVNEGEFGGARFEITGVSRSQ